MSKEDVNKILGIDVPENRSANNPIDKIPDYFSAENHLVKVGRVIKVVGVIMAMISFIAGIVASSNTYDFSDQILYFVMGFVGAVLIFLPCYAISAYFKVAANTSNTLKEIRNKLNSK